MKTRGYFTGNEEVYTRNVVALSQSALNRGFDRIPGEGGVEVRGPLTPKPAASLEDSGGLLRESGE